MGQTVVLITLAALSEGKIEVFLTKRTEVSSVFHLILYVSDALSPQNNPYLFQYFLLFIQ